MTKDQILKAVEVAAQERISKMFDVLCTEMTTARADYKAEALNRFKSGIISIRETLALANTAIEEGEGE